jgi:iron-sulfur cluster assembly protein
MSIKLTQSATQRVKTFLKRDGGLGLRLGVRKTGCSGWAYTVEIAEAIGESDIVFENDGVKVVVSTDSLGFIDGSEIDFVAQGLNREFRFNNPNASEECGCGESFTINPV